MTEQEIKDAVQKYQDTIVEERQLEVAGVAQTDPRFADVRTARRELLERAGLVRPLDTDSTSDWN